MGTPDDVVIGDRHGQVKMWTNACLLLHLGDDVDKPGSHYDVVMREGGYVHVDDGKLVGWDDDARDGQAIYDKWGTRLLDYPDSTYFFDSEEASDDSY